MASCQFEIRELAARWREVLARATSDGEVILTEDQIPKAKLVPLKPTTVARVPGLHPGAMVPAEDFDAPLPDEFWTGAS